MNDYRLYYLADGDDANWKKCRAKQEVQLGDILQLSCGFYHVVCKIIQQKNGVRLGVSKSCQTPDEAVLVAKQDGFYPDVKVIRLQPKTHSDQELIKVS